MTLLEVKPINKQKFIAELGKLLTFMYEDDRQTALNIYSNLFDGCENQEELAKNLVSPTRQAVVIARAYDSDGDEYDDEPAFVKAINNVISEIETKKKKTEQVSKSQYTFFSEGDVLADLSEDGELLYGTVGDEEENFKEKGAIAASSEKVLSGGKLALFLIIAIPLGLVLIALILALAALVFCVAAAAAVLAFYSISAAFNSGFDIIADILVVGGLAVVLAAIAVLALWTGIWLIFGMIPGSVRNVIELGDRLCREEVQ